MKKTGQAILTLLADSIGADATLPGVFLTRGEVLIPADRGIW